MQGIKKTGGGSLPVRSAGILAPAGNAAIRGAQERLPRALLLLDGLLILIRIIGRGLQSQQAHGQKDDADDPHDQVRKKSHGSPR